MSLVEVAFSGRNYASVRLYFISNTEGNDVALRAAELVKFPPERLPKLYEACNEANRKYRYVKFVVDPEKSVVNMEMDIQPLRERRRGRGGSCSRVAISRRGHPKLMQATWA